MRNPKQRLHDILEAIAAIERYASQGRERFQRDELLQTWFIRQLYVIGEAARGLPEDVRTKSPEIPWSKIIGMRNVLIHGYFQIDLELVWQTVVEDVPVLKPAVEQLLRDIEGNTV